MTVATIHLARPRLRSTEIERLQDMAPPAPPCFDGADQWHEYLAWCAASEERGFSPTVSGSESPTEAGAPSILHKRRMFNTSLPFCSDCAGGCFQRRMQAAGRCRPDWLRAREWAASGVPQQEAAACV